MSTRAVAMARWSYRFLWRRSEYVAPLGNQGTGGQTLHQRQLGYGFLMADGSSLPFGDLRLQQVANTLGLTWLSLRLMVSLKIYQVRIGAYFRATCAEDVPSENSDN